MAKNKPNSLRLMVRGGIEGKSMDEWDYLWVIPEDVKEKRKEGYVLFSEAK